MIEGMTPGVRSIDLVPGAQLIVMTGEGKALMADQVALPRGAVVGGGRPVRVLTTKGSIGVHVSIETRKGRHIASSVDQKVGRDTFRRLE